MFFSVSGDLCFVVSQRNQDRHHLKFGSDVKAEDILHTQII